MLEQCQMVVFATLEFSYEVRGGMRIRHDGVAKFSDARFKSISAIKECNVAAVLFY